MPRVALPEHNFFYLTVTKEEFPPVSPAGGHKPDPEVAFPSFSQPALQPRPKHRELPSPRLDPKR